MKAKRHSNIKALLLILPIVFSLFVVSSCSHIAKSKTKGSINLYYSDKNKTKLVTASYKPQSTKQSELVKELLDKMGSSPDKINYITAKPESVKIVNYHVTDSTLNIDFDSSYLQMDKVTELLCRSAIVLTITQIAGIDYVSFTVNEQPLADDQNNSISTMKASDFVDNAGSTINNYQELELTLYYANKSGDALVPFIYKGICSQNTSVEKFIIERLMKGASMDGFYKTLPSGLKLNSIITKDGICYVNFDNTFLDDSVNVTPQVELYSVVNSLLELTYINKVQISINGETDKKFRDYTSLNNTFGRNLDIVE